jgi:hypothetical protein
MADLRIRTQTTSKNYSSNGQMVDVQGLKDGTLPAVDWVMSKAIEGRVFHVSHGTVTTPITFVAYDEDRPAFALDVPAGTTIIPIRIQVYLEAAAGTVTEVIFETATNVVGAGTSTLLTPACTRTRGGRTTACTGYGLYTGNGTAPTGAIEFWRSGYPYVGAAGAPALIEWNVMNGTPQIIEGAGSLVGYVSATTSQVNGFTKVSWIELLTSEV